MNAGGVAVVTEDDVGVEAAEVVWSLGCWRTRWRRKSTRWGGDDPGVVVATDEAEVVTDTAVVDEWVTVLEAELQLNPMDTDAAAAFPPGWLG